MAADRGINEMGQAATRLAEGGLCIFPLCPRSKIPLPGSNGCRDATTDRRIIHAWWARTPRANIGIATGPGSGLWVLDVDGAEGRDALARLKIEHHQLPQTVTVETGNGLHLYWRWPKGGPAIRNSASRIAPGLDVRGEGGMDALGLRSA